jgi:hypothetical protein
MWWDYVLEVAVQCVQLYSVVTEQKPHGGLPQKGLQAQGKQYSEVIKLMTQITQSTRGYSDIQHPPRIGGNDSLNRANESGGMI